MYAGSVRLAWHAQQIYFAVIMYLFATIQGFGIGAYVAILLSLCGSSIRLLTATVS